MSATTRDKQKAEERERERRRQRERLYEAKLEQAARETDEWTRRRLRGRTQLSFSYRNLYWYAPPNFDPDALARARALWLHWALAPTRDERDDFAAALLRLGCEAEAREAG